MSLKNILILLKEYKPDADVSLVANAYNYSKKINEKQMKNKEQTYFKHCVNVAEVLAELKLDEQIISAGLLYTAFSIGETERLLRKEVGDEIVRLIQLNYNVNIYKEKIGDHDLELVKRMLIAIAKDPRVVLLQLASKLDGIRNLKGLSEEMQRKTAEETLNIYAPIAQRFGIWKIKNELEDKAFKFLNPKEYNSILRKTNDLVGNGDERIEEIKRHIQYLLKERNIHAEIYGRKKQIYSIYHKLYLGRKVRWEQLFDLIALRVIVQKKEDCYVVLGLINSEWEIIQDKFKDYIANPKPNGYQSIHIGFIDKEEKPFEVQIRTEEMHELAEEGIAAHWLYKNKGNNKDFDKKISWIRESLGMDATNIKELLWLDSFSENIYCFTPLGKIIELPESSTPIDFAYAIHQEVGDHCYGVKVNGKIRSLKSSLNNGDTVEILLSKQQSPRREWLSFVNTTKAKVKIKQALKKKGEFVTKFLKKEAGGGKVGEGLILCEFSYKKIKLAKCCKPIPGEEVIGYVTKGGRVTVHKRDCDEVGKTKLPEIDLGWNQNVSKPIELKVDAQDRLGIFTEVINKLKASGIKLNGVRSRLLGVGDIQATITLTIEDLNLLKKVIRDIQNVRNVKKVYVEI